MKRLLVVFFIFTLLFTSLLSINIASAEENMEQEQTIEVAEQEDSEKDSVAETVEQTVLEESHIDEDTVVPEMDYDNSLLEEASEVVTEEAAIPDSLNATDKAYAVLTSEGDLIFFRSNESYSDSTEQTVTDILGNRYTGTVYTQIEERTRPWHNRVEDIKKAYVAEGQTIKPTSIQNWFVYCKNMVSFDGTGIDTSAAQSMSWMFYGCQSLTEVDLNTFDTSSVLNMQDMFGNCISLTSLDLSNFSTAKVTDMSCMFAGCTSLKSVELSSFDTSSVTDMYSMFANCESLQSLDLSNFNTPNLTHMATLFYCCSSLKTLDISNFDTSSISGSNSMRDIFEECSSLGKVKLGAGFTKWEEDAYLYPGTWMNREKGLIMSEVELYEGYPSNASSWAGTWTKGTQEVVRLSGKSRFDTSLLIANMLKEVLGIKKFSTVILTTGDNYADALSASNLAVLNDAPILLIKESKANKICKYIKSNLKKNGKIYVLGSQSSVSDSWINGLKDLYKIERIYGSSRYGTNLAILKKTGLGNNEYAKVIVCDGRSYADALSAAGTGLPILLVDSKEGLKQSTKTFLSEQKAKYGNNHIFFTVVGSSFDETFVIQLSLYGPVTSGGQLSGTNRYLTSVGIANYYYKSANDAIIVWGENYPDGLCAGVLACKLRAPLLLSNSNKANTTKKYTVPHGVQTGIIMGGPGNLSDSLIRNIFQLDEDYIIQVRE